MGSEVTSSQIRDDGIDASFSQMLMNPVATEPPGVVPLGTFPLCCFRHGCISGTIDSVNVNGPEADIKKAAR